MGKGSDQQNRNDETLVLVHERCSLEKTCSPFLLRLSGESKQRFNWGGLHIGVGSAERCLRPRIPRTVCFHIDLLENLLSTLTDVLLRRRSGGRGRGPYADPPPQLAPHAIAALLLFED
ncbi:hypothetical protein EVAR_46521_1 [Eumeta japonica]|uniref:Uncharacterized protein n=1 Tax=Eumeta variegata TaxID=151549 RepID=A0A4C1WVR8_EUMVA|nr:hypothetical protein EVAR_46521_1 [Eumeta japonica]